MRRAGPEMTRPSYLRDIAVPMRRSRDIALLAPPRPLFRPSPTSRDFTIVEASDDAPQSLPRVPERPLPHAAPRPSPEPVRPPPEEPPAPPVATPLRVTRSPIASPSRHTPSPVAGSLRDELPPVVGSPRRPAPLMSNSLREARPSEATKALPPPPAGAPEAILPAARPQRSDTPRLPFHPAPRAAPVGQTNGESRELQPTPRTEQVPPRRPAGPLQPSLNVGPPAIADHTRRQEAEAPPARPGPATPAATPEPALIAPRPPPPRGPARGREAAPMLRIGTLEVRVVPPAPAARTVAPTPARVVRAPARIAGSARLARGFGNFGLSQA